MNKSMKKLKILFATDFSPNAKIAIKLLKRLKKNYATDIDLIHVVPSFWKDWFASGTYREKAKQRLRTWQLKLSRKQNNVKKLHVECGNPAESILRTAKLAKSNLIVLGDRAAEGSSRYKTGTTIEAVARHATKSVLICKGDSLSKILCGIDGSASSAKALQFAIDLCRHLSASLYIVSALPHGDFNPLGMKGSEIKKNGEKFKMEQIKKLNRFLGHFDFTNITVKNYFSWGAPENIILDTAEDFNQDLIVVGAKGHSLLRHILIGSTTEKVLRYSPCSLLIIR